MLLFIPRSLCALKRVAAKAEHHRFGATTGIRIALTPGLFRAEACDGNRAMVVQGLVPPQDPPWPGFKEVPDDACEAIVLPKDLERASKLGDGWAHYGMIGLATVGSEVYLGLGSDLINTRTVEGRFPQLERVIPTKRPLFTFRVDPKLLAETLLAVSDLLPDYGREVQCFYYGEGHPLGFCAKNSDTGMMIDALVVPLVVPKENPKPDAKAEGQNTKKNEPENKEPEGEDAKERPNSNRRGKKSKPAEAAPAEPTPGDTVAEQPKALEMLQYQEVKQRHPGMLVLFRVGDFYEVFEEDAEVAAKVLGLTLTTRDKILMAGFPHHSLEAHLRKLLQAGHRVAICDQVEDGPKDRREVTRVVTPTDTTTVPDQPLDTRERSAQAADPAAENAADDGQNDADDGQDAQGVATKRRRPRKSAS